MYCRNCGQALSADARICPKCGQPLLSQKAAVEDGVVSVGEWFVTMLLAGIPLVGIVMMFVWAFGNSNPSKKNWARASLIWTAVAALLLVLLAVFFGAAIFAFLASMAD